MDAFNNNSPSRYHCDRRDIPVHVADGTATVQNSVKEKQCKIVRYAAFIRDPRATQPLSRRAAQKYLSMRAEAPRRSAPHFAASESVSMTSMLSL